MLLQFANPTTLSYYLCCYWTPLVMTTLLVVMQKNSLMQMYTATNNPQCVNSDDNMMYIVVLREMQFVQCVGLASTPLWHRHQMFRRELQHLFDPLRELRGVDRRRDLCLCCCFAS